MAPPYVLVGHSVGGLIAQVYAGAYPREVAGVVLLDSTHEDTTLIYQGKVVRVRDRARGRATPPAQTMQSGPPRPPTDEDRKQAEFNAQVSGPPRIEAPFDKLPPDAQKLRLWMLGHSKLAAAAEDFWPDELQALHESRRGIPCPLGDRPLIVLVPSENTGPPPPNVPVDEWGRILAEKREQKESLAGLSRNSMLIRAEKSGHHIQLDQPDLVVSAIRRVVEAVRKNGMLSETR